MNDINPIAIILARGGSKDITNKNIETINKKSLLEISVNQIKKSINIDVFVSSDADNILDEAINLGCIAIKRPSNLSEDDSSSEEALIHSIDYIEKNIGNDFDTVIFPQLTSPLRHYRDFKDALALYIEGNYDSLFSSNDALDFLLWKKDKFGELMELNFDNKNRKPRQDKESQLIENGSFYIFDKNKFKVYRTRLFESIGEYRMESWQLFEIDNFQDLELCRHISKIKNSDGIYG